MRRKLSMVGFALLLLLLVNFNFAQGYSNETPKEFKIVVVGVALDVNTQQPEEGATIELQDLITKETSSYTTKQDGNFYFKLEADKKYLISKLNTIGDIVEQKDIMTIGIKDTEIFHIMFGSGYETIDNGIEVTKD